MTPTAELIAQAQRTPNPVTARVLWNIIGKRIDRALGGDVRAIK